MSMPQIPNSSMASRPISPAPARVGDVLLEEVLALQNILRDAQAKVNALVAALRHHRRERKVVQSALGSLLRLQQLPRP